ncbi:hypothetical protein V8F33_002214 [Rhypophila sp. PSN 637]
MPSASTVFASVQSASFRLQGSVQGVEPSERPFNDLCIAHPDGQPAGLLMAGDSGLGLGPEIIAKSKFEFIALSTGASRRFVLPDGRLKPDLSGVPSSDARVQYQDYERLSVEELQKLTFRDSEGEFLFPIPVVNVMMVERTGENSVRRISVGWIYLTFWIRAERKFVTVFLE